MSRLDPDVSRSYPNDSRYRIALERITAYNPKRAG